MVIFSKWQGEKKKKRTRQRPFICPCRGGGGGKKKKGDIRGGPRVAVFSSWKKRRRENHYPLPPRGGKENSAGGSITQWHPSRKKEEGRGGILAFSFSEKDYTTSMLGIDARSGRKKKRGERGSCRGP